MPTAVIDREETTSRLPKGSVREPERRWPAFLFLIILILTGVAGMGALFYKLEHPVPTQIFERR